MDPALRTAATGMIAQQTRTEVISNNLANVNTTGFKRSRAHFEDLLYQTVQGAAIVGQPDMNATPPIQIGRGVRLASVQRLHQQGPIEQTERPLDLAIEGEGFFQVQLPNGQVGYTRDGTFQLSDEGTLVTQQGFTVVPGIQVPQDATQVTISRTGTVSIERGAGGVASEVGRLELARFANPAGLMSMGENIYTATSASGEPVLGFAEEDNMGRIVQGYLEGSNVEIVQEMVDMITSLRAYEINSKAVKNSEEMSQIANNMVR
ncbi:MAG TPA: flagellar basal-body rod protein FlgG [Gemmatimonadaceae bacterium]|jgi:flagellar basal-body rod protein FlgG|nr:flagellar basal-body rod protein FlgG [Gemmatimonadaceae bacterium]